MPYIILTRFVGNKII